MANRLVVEIAGDTRPLERAFGKAGREAQTFERKTNRIGNRMRRGGMFAKAGLSAIAFSGYVDDAAESVLKHFGVSGDAANAIVGFGGMVSDLALNVDGLGGKLRGLGQVGKGSRTGAAVRGAGKATAVGLAGVAAYEVARHTPGWDSLWKKVGGSVADDVARVGSLFGRGDRPVELTVNLDGQTIAKNTTTRQKRAGARTANQTSGRRG